MRKTRKFAPHHGQNTKTFFPCAAVDNQHLVTEDGTPLIFHSLPDQRLEKIDVHMTDSDRLKRKKGAPIFSHKVLVIYSGAGKMSFRVLPVVDVFDAIFFAFLKFNFALPVTICVFCTPQIRPERSASPVNQNLL